MSLSYVNIEEVEMNKLNRELLAATGEAAIKQAMQKEPKLKSDMMQLKLKGGVTDALLQKLAAGMEDYFQFYTTLGNQFLDKYSKKYEPLAKQFVELQPSDYDAFLQQHVQGDEERARFVTMIRFLKQASSYSEPLQYVLQQSTEVQIKEAITMDNKQLQQKKKQITALLDELFTSIDGGAELQAAKEENTAYAKKIKVLEKKIATQQKELETAKANVLVEKKKVKESMEQFETLQEQTVKQLAEFEKVKAQAVETKVQYDQLIAKSKDQKTELVALRNKYEKQLAEQANKAAMEKQVVQAQLDSAQDEIAKANKKNEKLQLKLEQAETDKEQLLQQLQALQQLLAHREAAAATATVTEAVTITEEAQPVVQQSAVAVKENTDVQHANSERLKAMGFEPIDSLFDDEDDDLFDLDENKPLFD